MAVIGKYRNWLVNNMKLLFALFFLVLSWQSQAFSRTGHHMVCDMAFELMSKQSQTWVQQLVSMSDVDSFAAACVWPDEVRSEPEFRWSAPHHYVNMQRGQSSVTNESCPEVGCVLSAIADMQQRLKKDPLDWQALFFFAHHLGDLHQPLHVSFADDLGGNRTAVYFLNVTTPSNLHGVWDRNIISHLGYDDDLKKRQALLQAINGGQQQSWRKGKVLDWANESAAITVALYEEYRPGMLIDEAYITRHSSTLEQRLQQAAVRLAMLIDLLFAKAQPD